MEEKSLDHFTAKYTTFKYFSNENGIQNEQSTVNAKITAVYFSKIYLQDVFLIYEPYIYIYLQTHDYRTHFWQHQTELTLANLFLANKYVRALKLFW